MISLVVAAVLLLIHALVCLVLWTLMKLGLLPVRGHMLVVMVLLPLWGPLLVVLLSVRSAVFGGDLKDATLETLRINDDMHRSMLVQGREGDDGVVPLEEALIVNDPGDPPPSDALHAYRGSGCVPGTVAGSKTQRRC